MKILPQQLQIEFEQVNFVYDHLATGLLMNMLVGGSICIVMRQVLGFEIPLIWYTVLLLMVSLRFGVLCLYKRSRDKIIKLPQWRRAFILASAGMGMVWGVGGILLLPQHDVTRQIFLSFIVGGMVMGAVPYLSPLLQSYLFFMLFADVPLSMYFFTFGDTLHVVLGIVNLFFVISMLVAARLNQKNFVQNLNLRFVNQDLVKRLNDTNNELEHKIYIQNKIEEDLRENKLRLEALSNAAHDGVILHKNGLIIEANEAAARMAGYTVNELIGMPVLELIIPECHADILSRFLNPKDEPFDTSCRRKDGSIFRAELNPGSVTYQGEPARIVSVRDISKQKQIEEKLVHAKNAAEEADNLKSEFLASVSHELRTPLNAIVGIMQILNDSQMNKQQHDYLDMGEKAANQLLLLINDLLDLSRIETGHFEYQLQAANLNALLYETVQIISFKARERKDELQLVISEDLPEWVCIDPERVKQVLINLLGNAVKFTEGGKVILTVTTEQSAQAGQLLRFEVKDSGIGIPYDKQRVIFNRFTQLDASISRNYGGAGLGLAISRELIKKMGGDIGVSSQPGAGATFWFSLPCEQVSPPRQEAQPGAVPAVKQDLYKGLAVLVVEDEETNQIITRHMLEKLGCHVDVLGNGQQAVDTDTKYDLIFMDMQMPVLDGLAATQQLRNKGVTTPIIALTANAMQGDRERCKQAGMDDYITKPVERGALQQVIARWIPPSKQTASV